MDPDFDTRRCLGILEGIGQVPKRGWEHWDVTELTSEWIVGAKGCSELCEFPIHWKTGFAIWGTCTKIPYFPKNPCHLSTILWLEDNDNY